MAALFVEIVCCKDVEALKIGGRLDGCAGVGSGQCQTGGVLPHDDES